MAERYEIKGTIGRGGIGAVYRAVDTVMGRDVAIKRLLPLEQTRLNQSAEDSLKREAAALARLNHPNILTIYAFEEDDDGPYVVTEMIEGEDLKKTIERGALPLEDFEAIVFQTLDPLIAALAAGLQHRDIKPANIMLQWLSTGRFQIKILDFGLAKFSQKPSLQTLDQTGSFLGSIDFIAPEQIDLKPLDNRTDLYSLGCVYYYTLAQRPPFEDSTPALTMNRHLNHVVTPLIEIRPDLPSAIADWVMRLIQLDPTDRPESAADALQEFRQARVGVSPLNTPAVVPPPDAATEPLQAADDHETAGPRTATGRTLIIGDAATSRQATAPRSRTQATNPARAKKPSATVQRRGGAKAKSSIKGPLIALLICLVVSVVLLVILIQRASAKRAANESRSASDGAGASWSHRPL